MKIPETIDQLLTNVFGDKKTFALDYLSIMLKNPEQKLPILFIRGPQGSGKSTFTSLLSNLFGNESAFIHQTYLSAPFYNDWKKKTVVIIDDYINNEEDFLYLKQIITSKELSIDLPQKPSYTITSKIHLVLISNSIYSPFYVNTRCFWIVSPKAIIPDFDFGRKVHSEIEQFKTFLISRKIGTKSNGTLFFDVEKLNY